MATYHAFFENNGSWDPDGFVAIVWPMASADLPGDVGGENSAFFWSPDERPTWSQVAGFGS